MEFSVRIPFVELLGFELQKFEGGEAEIGFKPSDDHLNSFDVTRTANGTRIVVDAASLEFLDGSRIDFVIEGLKQSFKFDNPNVDSECGCGESFNVKKPAVAASAPTLAGQPRDIS